MVHSRRSVDLGRVLAAAEAASPVDAVDRVARELGATFAAVAVSFLITDLSGRALVRLAHVPLGEHPDGAADASALTSRERREEEELATVVPFDGGPEEQAIRIQRVQVVPPDGSAGESGDAASWRVLAPVTERGESIGLLAMQLPEEPDGDELAEIAQVAHLLAFVVIANRRHTDLFEWGQRTRGFSLSAEIQQRLLPEARTCEAAAFTLAGWLEPAASIGGDTFDYSLERNRLHVSLTDAMGHGVGAALTASMCLAGLRGGRRTGMSLLEQAVSANTALSERGARDGSDDFVTGLISRLDLATGVLDIVNAGHVPPYLLRDSKVMLLDLRVDLPLGMFDGSGYGSSQLQLEAGDRIVFVTDGMLERKAASIHLPTAIRETSALHPREVVRALADSALAAAGHSLQDDATVLCLDWHGTHDEDRAAVSGADSFRASDPLPLG